MWEKKTGRGPGGCWQTYADFQTEDERRMGAIIRDCGVFFAFSDEQFEENRTPIEEGDKYVSIGMGGYLPKSRVPDYRRMLDNHFNWQREAIKAVDPHEVITYELSNHECYYTGDYTDALPVLEHLGFTEEQIRAEFL